jgi:hypothetical protein
MIDDLLKEAQEIAYAYREVLDTIMDHLDIPAIEDIKLIANDVYLVVEERNELIEQLAAEKARAEELTKHLELICERAVVDFDDETVGMVNRAIGPVTYGDWLREMLGRAARAEKAEAERDALLDALSPDKTKALLMGEFHVWVVSLDEDANIIRVPICWGGIKEIQAAILEQARLNMGWQCSGCGSTQHILTIRDRTGAISCCPERCLVPAKLDAGKGT